MSGRMLFKQSAQLDAVDQLAFPFRIRKGEIKQDQIHPFGTDFFHKEGNIFRDHAVKSARSFESHRPFVPPEAKPVKPLFLIS